MTNTGTGRQLCKPLTIAAYGKILFQSWVWWYIPVITVLRRLRQEDHELEVSLSYIVRPCLKKINK
jgi:hypothetical protein